MEALRSEGALLALAADDDPALAFVGIAGLRDAADSLERYQVEQARASGWTWAEIGRCLGVSAQAAHRRHAGNLE